jgi:hypothetical protein
MTGRSTYREVVRQVAPPCDYLTHDHARLVCVNARLVVRPCKTYMRPLTIWNRRSEVLNMPIDLAATDFAMAITHYNQSSDRSTIFPIFIFTFLHFARS